MKSILLPPLSGRLPRIVQSTWGPFHRVISGYLSIVGTVDLQPTASDACLGQRWDMIMVQIGQFPEGKGRLCPFSIPMGLLHLRSSSTGPVPTHIHGLEPGSAPLQS